MKNTFCTSYLSGLNERETRSAQIAAAVQFGLHRIRIFEHQHGIEKFALPNQVAAVGRIALQPRIYLTDLVFSGRPLEKSE